MENIDILEHFFDAISWMHLNSKINQFIAFTILIIYAIDYLKIKISHFKKRYKNHDFFFTEKIVNFCRKLKYKCPIFKKFHPIIVLITISFLIPYISLVLFIIFLSVFLQLTHKIKFFSLTFDQANNKFRHYFHIHISNSLFETIMYVLVNILMWLTLLLIAFLLIKFTKMLLEKGKYKFITMKIYRFPFWSACFLATSFYMLVVTSSAPLMLEKVTTIIVYLGFCYYLYSHFNLLKKFKLHFGKYKEYKIFIDGLHKILSKINNWIHKHRFISLLLKIIIVVFIFYISIEIIIK